MSNSESTYRQIMEEALKSNGEKWDDIIAGIPCDLMLDTPFGKWATLDSKRHPDLWHVVVHGNPPHQWTDEYPNTVGAFWTSQNVYTEVDDEYGRGFVCASRNPPTEAMRKDVLVLNAEDSKAFVDALLNPQPPTERMKQAMARHKELFGEGQKGGEA